ADIQHRDTGARESADRDRGVACTPQAKLAVGRPIEARIVDVELVHFDHAVHARIRGIELGRHLHDVRGAVGLERAGVERPGQHLRGNTVPGAAADVDLYAVDVNVRVVIIALDQIGGALQV